VRTTLDINDDVLAAAEQMAVAQNATVGSVISALAGQTLRRQPAISYLPLRNGVRMLPRAGGVVTAELVEKLMEPEFCAETGLWIV
jgi:hypothetical protein